MADITYGFIYMINSICKPKMFYIGSTVNWVKRRSMHKRWLERNKHSNTILQNHVNKYGIEDLVFSVIEKFDFISKEHLLNTEQRYLDVLKPLFNISKVAGSCLGMKHGRPSPEKIEKLRRGSMGNKNFLGKKHTEEARAKISKGNKGKPKSKKHREALSRAWDIRRLTYKPSEKFINALKNRKNRKPNWNKGLTKYNDGRLMQKSINMTGKPMPNETKIKISRSLKERKKKH